MGSDKPTWKTYASLTLLALMVWGLIAAIQMMDNEELKSMLKETPLATGTKFFFFSQAFGSITPVWKIPVGASEIYIPYPDATDIFGLLFFAIIARLIISAYGLEDNEIASFFIFTLSLIFGWFIWKLIMYLLFIYMGQGLGNTYSELVAIRAGAIARGEKLGVFFLVLSLITFLANAEALKRD